MTSNSAPPRRGGIPVALALAEGVQGTMALFDGTPLPTAVLDKVTLQASIPSRCRSRRGGRPRRRWGAGHRHRRDRGRPRGLAADRALRNRMLRVSGAQGAPLGIYEPWRSSTLLAAAAYAVVGDVGSAPAEKPALVPYANVGGLGGKFFPFATDEYACALYDAHGRCVDVIRTTGHDDAVVHNDPRPPARWSEFTGASDRAGLARLLGRNATSTDADVGEDFRALPTRTMGFANAAPTQPWTTSMEPHLDARLHDTLSGRGLALVLNGGASHAGERWSIAVSFGHAQGQGPLLGLGPDALANYQLLSATPPFFGHLDAFGSARLDVAPGTLPAGLAFDAIVLLQDPTGAVTTLTRVLEFDT